MLRNVTLTAPYFHDGKVATLAEAMDEMAWMELDKKLSNAEIDAILRFLTSLADNERTVARSREPITDTDAGGLEPSDEGVNPGE